MKRLLALALITPLAAHAADLPCYQYGPDNSCLPIVVPVTPTGNPASPFASAATGGGSSVGTQATPNVSTPPTVTYTAPTSSSIATGGTAQNAAAANTITHGCDLQNPATATEPLYYSLTGAAGSAASGTTFALAAGQPYHCPFPTTQALSVNAATTGHTFSLVVY